MESQNNDKKASIDWEDFYENSLVFKLLIKSQICYFLNLKVDLSSQEFFFLLQLLQNINKVVQYHNLLGEEKFCDRDVINFELFRSQKDRLKHCKRRVISKLKIIYNKKLEQLIKTNELQLKLGGKPDYKNFMRIKEQQKLEVERFKAFNPESIITSIKGQGYRINLSASSCAFFNV